MSNLVLASNLHNWHHDSAAEAAKEIFEAVGDLSVVELFGAQILIGDYIRPEKTKGGILTTVQTQAEDAYQGKVGIILKIGPNAFDEKDLKDFGGQAPKVGDWVFFRAQDGVQVSIKLPGSKKSPTRDWQGWPCRLFYPADLYGRVSEPQVIV